VRSAHKAKPHGDVLVGVVAALYAGLRFCGAVKAALYKLDFALGLVEFGVCLGIVRFAFELGAFVEQQYLGIIY
jgi:hypothetical protein